MDRDLATYQENYNSLPFEATQARFRKRKILESLAKYRPENILEIGCGLDPLFNHYNDFAHCTIVEPAASFFDGAVRSAASRGNISIMQGTIEEWAPMLTDHSYDFILLSSLLHEIPDSAALLNAVSILCNDATIVHVNVPNANSFHRLLALEMGLIGDVHDASPVQKRMQQSHTFDQDTLAALMRRHRFSIVESGTFFLKPFTHAQMAELYASGFASERMLDGFYRLCDRFPDNGSEIFVNAKRQS